MKGQLPHSWRAAKRLESHHVTEAAWRITYLDAVVGLLVDDGDVLPAELEDDLGHGEGLVVVAGDGARKVLEALLVRQLGARREERDLEEKSSVRVVD